MDKAASYYERVQLGGAAQKIVSSLRQDAAQKVFEPLKELAVASKTTEPTSEKMLLNASFLVDRANEALFDQKVNEVHDKWDDKVEFSYSGPWPAYNFVNIRLTVDA
ncbi:GvpL/GvpF family gas vesicle protein [Bacillus sp. ISL-18]|uniref:GvpL/GvpF family gas vesicle protein n=1 Tax=Bacillus sp. ISL-18 TaxID=2819118 RepID=UPI001BE7937C|nr:GvpL/GvpF family gas vesicle protein [Bacillus sp. ISL-18]MBT2656715.1 GvpL/GvpF family gas vesicle protein [Bacillus sp. ISL-18]